MLSIFSGLPPTQQRPNLSPTIHLEMFQCYPLIIQAYPCFRILLSAWQSSRSPLCGDTYLGDGYRSPQSGSWRTLGQEYGTKPSQFWGILQTWDNHLDRIRPEVVILFWVNLANLAQNQSRPWMFVRASEILGVTASPSEAQWRRDRPRLTLLWRGFCKEQN